MWAIWAAGPMPGRKQGGPKPQKGSLYTRVDCLNVSGAGIEGPACCKGAETPALSVFGRGKTSSKA